MNKNILIGSIVVIIVIVGIVFVASQNPNPSTQTVSSEEGKIIERYSGKVLAGSTSPYIVFNKTDYEKALTDNKIVFLDFFANWCPICRDEAPNLKEGFDALQTDKVVGFRVNYNDTETDEDEKKLAQEFGITYQHTKVILKNGKEVLRTLEEWDRQEFAKQINAALQ